MEVMAVMMTMEITAMMKVMTTIMSLKRRKVTAVGFIKLMPKKYK